MKAYLHALDIQDRAGGQRDPIYLYSLVGVGRAEVLSGKPHDALAPLERALALDAQTEAASAEARKAAAETRFLLAEALWSTGTRSSRVGELARAAAEIYERADKPDDARQVRRWLAEHGPGGS